MNVIYEKIFLKDLENLDENISKKLKSILLELEEEKSISNVKNVRKMSGFNDYYRIRIWEFRLGLKISNNNCIVKRIKHRKDIYKIFP